MSPCSLALVFYGIISLYVTQTELKTVVVVVDKVSFDEESCTGIWL